MKLTFLGTRGGIIARSPYHTRHSSLLISYHNKKIMVDCGQDWLDYVYSINPSGIIITHAHLDHVGGLEHGAPCPVYATEDTWDKICRYPIEIRRVVKPRQALTIGKVAIEPFTVDHSLNAPAVGYRITAGKTCLFYVPDLVEIHDQKRALSHAALYVGDGAIISRTLLIRKRDSIRIGHAPITTQLGWCQQEKVPYALFTHCGSEIVKESEEVSRQKIIALGQQYAVKAMIAYDGLTFTL
jgi:phosphoribosyl 1,2-cyclic phosphodiesterase